MVIKCVILAGNLESGWGFFNQMLPTKLVADDGCAGKETIPPAMVSMMVGVNNIPNGKIEFAFNEFPNFHGFLGYERVNDDCPLGTDNCTCRHLSVCFTLKPINIFRYAFALHRTILKLK